jgi:hypothetical protein
VTCEVAGWKERTGEWGESTAPSLMLGYGESCTLNFSDYAGTRGCMIEIVASENPSVQITASSTDLPPLADVHITGDWKGRRAKDFMHCTISAGAPRRLVTARQLKAGGRGIGVRQRSVQF